MFYFTDFLDDTNQINFGTIWENNSLVTVEMQQSCLNTRTAHVTILI